MSRRLEEYLRKHRASLDVESPDDDAVWERVEERLSEKSNRRSLYPARNRWIAVRNIAAVAIIMFSVGYITNDIINSVAVKKSVTLSSIDRNLGNREEEYRRMVNLRFQEVQQLQADNNSLVAELFSELAELDSIYNQSLTDLKVLGPNDKVINTIFDTYEQKIRLLELIILETNKTKNHEDDEKIAL
jgi:hypothetical protein